MIFFAKYKDRPFDRRTRNERSPSD